MDRINQLLIYIVMLVFCNCGKASLITTPEQLPQSGNEQLLSVDVIEGLAIGRDFYVTSYIRHNEHHFQLAHFSSTGKLNYLLDSQFRHKIAPLNITVPKLNKGKKQNNQFLLVDFHPARFETISQVGNSIKSNSYAIKSNDKQQWLVANLTLRWILASLEPAADGIYLRVIPYLGKVEADLNFNLPNVAVFNAIHLMPKFIFMSSKDNALLNQFKDTGKNLTYPFIVKVDNQKYLFRFYKLNNSYIVK